MSNKRVSERFVFSLVFSDFVVSFPPPHSPFFCRSRCFPARAFGEKEWKERERVEREGERGLKERERGGGLKEGEREGVEREKGLKESRRKKKEVEKKDKGEINKKIVVNLQRNKEGKKRNNNTKQSRFGRGGRKRGRRETLPHFAAVAALPSCCPCPC